MCWCLGFFMESETGLEVTIIFLTIFYMQKKNS